MTPPSLQAIHCNFDMCVASACMHTDVWMWSVGVPMDANSKRKILNACRVYPARSTGRAAFQSFTQSEGVQH